MPPVAPQPLESPSPPDTPTADPTPTPTSLPELISHVIQEAGVQPDAPVVDPVTWQQSWASPTASPQEPGGGEVAGATGRRPSDDQTRFVIGILLGIVLLGLLLSIPSLVGLRHSSLVLWGGKPYVPLPSAAPTPMASKGPSPTVPATASPSPTGRLPVVIGINAIDPLGDGDENGASAPRAIDGNASSSWHSSTYRTAAFGGLKNGLGLILELEEPSTVGKVTLTGSGSGGKVELRTAENPEFEGSTVVADGSFSDGKVTLTPSEGANTQYVVVWFTELPQDDGLYRLNLFEIEVR